MEGFEPSRRKSLLDHFSAIKDTRQSCKVMDRLEDVLLLVVSGSNCSCDDYDDIALWGQTHLEFLRKLAPFHWCCPAPNAAAFAKARGETGWRPFDGGQADRTQ